MSIKRILIILIIIGAALRWFNLSESASFFYDQARDAIKVTAILGGKFTLIGPTTDSAGLFMGPLWFYFLAPLYKISAGNPVWVTALVSLFDLATIPLFYLVGRLFFNRQVSLFAAAIWTVNAHAVAYARTLANPSTTVFWTLLLVYLLHKKRIIFSSIIYATIFQFNPAAGFMFLPFMVIYYFQSIRKQVDIKTQILAAGIFISSFCPQIAFELRHQFIGFKSIPATLSGGGGNFVGVWRQHYSIWLQEAVNNTFFESSILAMATFLLGLRLVIKDKGIKEKKLFLLWAIIPIVTFIFIYFRGESHPHYLMTWSPIMIFLLAYLFYFIKQRDLIIFIFLVAVLVRFNQLGLYREIIMKDHLAQPADPNFVSFNDQVRTIDSIYQDAKGHPFGYFAYNITPYWADENWQYLFSWYGKNKYGYVPERNNGKVIYIIYESDPFFGNVFQGPWLSHFNTLEYKTLLNFQNGSLKIRKMEQ